MNYITKFRSLIEKKDYPAVAELYFNMAWKYQSTFNMMLEHYNIKEGIFDIIGKVETDFWVDPAGGTHCTDDDNPSTMYI